MEGRILLSILIPAYNAESYLPECLDSIVFQQGIGDMNFNTMIEILIANDGSTDNTGRICDQYVEKYGNIKVYHKKNEGLSLTREFLVSHASGEYIIFVDADDRWQKNLLETIMPLINKYDMPDMISFGFNIWEKEKESPCYVIKEKEMYIDLMKENIKGWKLVLCSDFFNALWIKVIKRSVLRKSKISRELVHIRRGEDKLLTIACMENATSWVLIQECLYDYRIDNLSMTRSFQPDYFDEILQVEQYVYEKICQYKLESSFCDWANSLLKKWNDYIFALGNADLTKGEIQKYRKRYRKSKLLKQALHYGRKHTDFKCRIRAWLLSFRCYKILNLYYRVIERKNLRKD